MIIDDEEKNGKQVSEKMLIPETPEPYKFWAGGREYDDEMMMMRRRRRMMMRMMIRTNGYDDELL